MITDLLVPKKMLFSMMRYVLAGLRFAGTRDGNAQELLYKYAVYFLNEVCLEIMLLQFALIDFENFTIAPVQIKPVCASNANGLPKGLSHYVDRGTLEAYLHLIVLSLCVVGYENVTFFLNSQTRLHLTSTCGCR